MDDERFRECVGACEVLPGRLADGHYHGYPHPLDAKLDALCALYLDASPAQRRQLVSLALLGVVRSGEALVAAHNLLTYIRRCGRRIHGEGDTQPMRLAMIAAALAGGQVDERDLAVTLVFLRAGADRAGISTSKALRTLDEVLREQSCQPDVPSGEQVARRIIVSVWRSDEETIARILAYHVGTG
jgi:hypothetical protein